MPPFPCALPCHTQSSLELRSIQLEGQEAGAERTSGSERTSGAERTSCCLSLLSALPSLSRLSLGVQCGSRALPLTFLPALAPTLTSLTLKDTNYL